MESVCAFDVWLHELGYTYNGAAPITGLTQFELDKLQLGWIVREEQKQDQMNAEAGGRSSHTARRKREHQQRLERKSRELQRN